MRTFSTKPAEITRKWFVVDAEGMVLGRLATEVARVLRGKHNPYFAPHLDTGDHVIIINADKVILTSNKAERKFAYRHSGYPGGLRTDRYTDLLATKPVFVVEKAIKGMLPKNRLGAAMYTKLKVYAGPTHPHGAQMPEPMAIDGAIRASR